MNTFKISLIAILAVISGFATAESTMSGKTVTISGERSAREVCKAVISDNPVRLRRVLKDYKSTLVNSYTFNLTSTSIAGSYTCNGMALTAFSQEIGAENIAHFLRTGEISSAPVVASSGN